MQIVIDISEELYQMCKDLHGDADPVERAIANGTPLPKGHGRLIDADALIDTLGCSDRDIYVGACIEEDAPTIIEADIPTMYYPQVEGITPTVISSNGSDMLSAEEIDNLLQALADGESEDRETCWDTISKEAEEYEADLDN